METINKPVEEPTTGFRIPTEAIEKLVKAIHTQPGIEKFYFNSRLGNKLVATKVKLPNVDAWNFCYNPED